MINFIKFCLVFLLEISLLGGISWFILSNPDIFLYWEKKGKWPWFFVCFPVNIAIGLFLAAFYVSMLIQCAGVCRGYWWPPVFITDEKNDSDNVYLDDGYTYRTIKEHFNAVFFANQNLSKQDTLEQVKKQIRFYKCANGLGFLAELGGGVYAIFGDGKIGGLIVASGLVLERLSGNKKNKLDKQKEKLEREIREDLELGNVENQTDNYQTQIEVVPSNSGS